MPTCSQLTNSEFSKTFKCLDVLRKESLILSLISPTVNFLCFNNSSIILNRLSLPKAFNFLLKFFMFFIRIYYNKNIFLMPHSCELADVMIIFLFLRPVSLIRKYRLLGRVEWKYILRIFRKILSLLPIFLQIYRLCRTKDKV